MKKDTETSLSIPEWQMSEAWVKWFLSYILPQNIGKKKLLWVCEDVLKPLQAGWNQDSITYGKS